MEDKTEVLTSITSLATRYNTTNRFNITLLNKGKKIDNGELIFYYDQKTNYNNSSPLMEDDGSKLIYKIEDFNPFQRLKFEVFLDMPSQEFIGETINLKLEIVRFEENENILIDSSLFESTILCSYDPNDKQVSPVGIKDKNYTLKDSELQYTVRFQNTGNAAAIDVTILDTLSEHLDLETFKVVNSSFPVFTTLSDQADEFYFQDIWLIDSFTNEPESHGYVSYTISPKADLPDETEIENTAHIIFDFNPAIITNTTKNTLVENLPFCPVGTEDLNLPHIQVYPIPFVDELNISISQGDIQDVFLFDIQGRMINNAIFDKSRNSLNTKTLMPGIYVLEVQTLDGHRIIEKVIKE